MVRLWMSPSNGECIGAHLIALVCKATWHVVHVLVLARCVCVSLYSF